MSGKRGIGSLLIVLIIVAVIVGLYYYNANISGAVSKLPAECIANPELAGWDNATIRSKIGFASFGDVDIKCNKYSVPEGCEGWKVAGSTQSICVWNRECGNGVIDSSKGEQCEGNDKFGGKTCADYGKANGNLVCRVDCKVDISHCY